MKHALTSQADDLGLSEEVRFLGNRRNQIVRKMMTGYEFLLLPSLTEVSPRVIVEACEAGLPVFALDAELSDMAKPGAIVVPSDDKNAAHLLAYIGTDPGIATSARSAMLATSEAWPSTSQLVNALIEVYHSAVRR